MSYQPINFKQKLTKFDEYWSPKVIAQMNDYQLKLVKVKDDFVWHSHADTDEVFIVISGQLEIEFRDGKISLSSGEMYVVPKGKEHKPSATEECQVLLIEPDGVVNTGKAGGELTAQNDVWI